nr:hypothetical protein [Tanacetum cinerariifolium]
MGSEDISIIPKKKSDEFIKSSVEDLVLIPSESKDTFESDSQYVLPSCGYVSNLDEPDLLVTPLFDANKDECFDSRDDDDEINVLDCEDGYYDSEGDILYLESLLNDDLVHRDPSIPTMSVASILAGFTDELPLKENDDLFYLESKNDDWKKILYDAPILMTADKIFDPGIHDQNFSPTYSSVEDLVLIPSESKDTFESDSHDDESLSDEDVPEDNVKIYSNPLFKFDDEYISSDVNPLFDEMLEDIKCKVSYDSNLDESTLLVTPLFDSNEDECLVPGDDVELLFHCDPSIPKMSVASILEGFTDEPPLKRMIGRKFCTMLQLMI